MADYTKIDSGFCSKQKKKKERLTDKFLNYIINGMKASSFKIVNGGYHGSEINFFGY